MGTSATCHSAEAKCSCQALGSPRRGKALTLCSLQRSQMSGLQSGNFEGDAGAGGGGKECLLQDVGHLSGAHLRGGRFLSSKGLSSPPN